MKKNSLLESAAEILKQSQGNAPKEPMHPAPGTVQDLGGTTTQTNVQKSLDPGTSPATPPGQAPDSSKKAPLQKVANGATEIDPLEQGDDVEGEAAERKARIEAGLAAGDLKEEEDAAEKFKQELKEDVQKILSSETGLSPEFAAKIGTIYEARVIDKLSAIEEELTEEFNGQLEEAVLQIRTDLTEQVNDYLNYVIEQWVKDNELAVEQGIRTELTEEFIEGLRNLFAEHYIDIPTEKVNVVEELAAKIEELSGQLNDQVGKNVDLQKQLTEAKKQEVLKNVCEGLTQTQTEKIKTLAESVDFTAEGEYTQKVTTIRENYFPTSQPKKVDAKVLTEASEPLAGDEKKQPVSSDPEVAATAEALKQIFK